jgi:hypothetical protein
MIVHRNPADLRPHPLSECLHDLADTDVRFTALVDAKIEHGFDPDKPLTIVPHNRILDGRHRDRVARIAELKQVPCNIVADEPAATVILDSIVARKHFTKSALAFECYPLFKQAHEEAKARHFDNLKEGAKTPAFPVSHSVGLFEERGHLARCSRPPSGNFRRGPSLTIGESFV